MAGADSGNLSFWDPFLQLRVLFGATVDPIFRTHNRHDVLYTQLQPWPSWPICRKMGIRSLPEVDEEGEVRPDLPFCLRPKPAGFTRFICENLLLQG